MFSNPERRMLNIGAKEELKLHILPPGFDTTNGKTMLYALSGDSIIRQHSNDPKALIPGIL